MAEMSLWITLLAAAATVTAVVLTILSVLAYYRERRARFMLIALAFAALSTRAIVVSASLISGRSIEDLMLWTLGLDAGALLLLYLAAVR